MEIVYNWWAIAGGTVTSMLLGMIWYSDTLFKKQWMKAAKLSKKDIKSGGPKPMIIATVRAFLIAFALYNVIYVTAEFFTDASWFTNSWQVGAWMGVVFGSLGIKMHDAFENRPAILTKINAGFEVVSILLAALFIGIIGR